MKVLPGFMKGSSVASLSAHWEPLPGLGWEPDQFWHEAPAKRRGPRQSRELFLAAARGGSWLLCPSSPRAAGRSLHPGASGVTERPSLSPWVQGLQG